jgi:predicted Zn-dependent protease with MMP-like domain
VTNKPDPFIDLKAPSLDEMQAMADEAYARLPDEFRSLCEGLVIQVTDFPDDDVLKEFETDDPFALLGLFQGVGLAQGGGLENGVFPNLIWLYRRPILDYWADHEDSLGEIVTHVLVHEIGHHFGLSDEDMEALEASVRD